MSKTTFFNYYAKHFSVTALILILLIYFQSIYLGRSSHPWLAVDLVTIYIVYVCVENFLFSAVAKIVIAGLLMQSLSLAPTGFFLMYYISLLAFANIASRFFVLSKIDGQIILFSALFLLKFVFLYLIFVTKSVHIPLMEFVRFFLPSFVVTTIAAVPVFSFLIYMDSRFYLPGQTIK